jgi:prepilin-type processing-associated H-X9-DG protein
VDYALNKGANGSMAHNSADRCPGTLRGVFHIQFSGTKHRVNLTSILDGASNTFAIGEAVSNSPMVEKTYRVLDFANFTAPWTTRTATPTNSHKFYQAWGAATVGVCVPGAHYGHYGSVFGVTAQYGIAPDYIDEPLNAPIIAGTCGLEISEPTGTNVPSVNLPNSVSGFRGLHTNGANFVYCDGAVRFIRTGVDQDTYRAMSTIAGADLVSQFDD